MFDQLVYWHWWIFGLGMLILEAFMPGAIFLWLGISAAVVGLLILIFPSIPWEWQFIVFAALSVVTVVTWRLWIKPKPTPSDRPALNRRGEQIVGRSFTLTDAIVNNTGKLVVDDTTWRVAGPDLPAGTKVKVAGVDGTTLKVEPA